VQNVLIFPSFILISVLFFFNFISSMMQINNVPLKQLTDLHKNTVIVCKRVIYVIDACHLVLLSSLKRWK